MSTAKARVGGAWVDTALAGFARVSGLWVPFGPSSGGVERFNLCPNPAAKNNLTDWNWNGGSTTIVRETGVTGMQRTTAVHLTGNGFFTTPIGACGGSEEWTISYDLKNQSGVPIFGRDIYLVSHKSGGGEDYQQIADTPALPDGDVGRGSITGTTTADAIGVSLLFDMGSPGIGCRFTAFLYEQSGTANPYFDGDSPNAAWDGADGNSTSTETT